MINCTMQVEGNELVIRVRLDKPVGPSGSGKTTILATTAGNVGVPGREEVRVGLNVYTKRS